MSPDPHYKQDEVMSVLRHLSANDITRLHEIVLDLSSREKDIDEAAFMSKIDGDERKFFRELCWEACSVFQIRNALQIKDTVASIERLKVHDAPIESFPRFFNPIYTSQRLNIPTVHVWGRNDSDSLKRLSHIGRDLCLDETATVIEHSGRHELPMRREDATAVANAVEKAFYLGQQQAITV